MLLLYPYHASLRMKLWIQRRVSTEPHWTLITDGWSVVFAQASMPSISCAVQIQQHHDVCNVAKGCDCRNCMYDHTSRFMPNSSLFNTIQALQITSTNARHSITAVMTHITKLPAICCDMTKADQLLPATRHKTFCQYTQQRLCLQVYRRLAKFNEMDASWHTICCGLHLRAAAPSQQHLLVSANMGHSWYVTFACCMRMHQFAYRAHQLLYLHE